MEKNKISLITSFYNMESLVDKTAAAVLAQTYDNFEWIVADDFSQDRTKRKLKNLTQVDKRIVCVGLDRKRSVFWNPQKYASGEICVILDGDDCILPHALEMINFYFNMYPDMLFAHFGTTAYWDYTPYDNGGDLIKGFDHLVYCSRNYDSILDGMWNLSPQDPHIYGSLYAWRNIPIEFPEYEYVPGQPFPSNDLQWLLKLEERGKGCFFPRTFHVQRRRRNSENLSNWSVAGEMILIKAARERRKKMVPLLERRLRSFDDIYQVAESVYISRLNYETSKKRIVFINFDLTDEQEGKVETLFKDHDCSFDLKKPGDYYFVHVPPDMGLQDFYGMFNRVLREEKETVVYFSNKRMTHNFDIMHGAIKKSQPHHMWFEHLNRYSFYFMFNWSKPDLFSIRNYPQLEDKESNTMLGNLVDLYETILPSEKYIHVPATMVSSPLMPGVAIPTVALKTSKPKVKLVHLLSQPTEEREIESCKSLSILKNCGIEYIQKVNEPYNGEVPGNSFRPNLSKGHYGNYLAFKKALDEFTEDVDFLMICECDCLLEVSPDKFVDLLYKVCNVMEKENISYFSFGDRIHQGDGSLVSPVIRDINDFMYETNKIICAHMILFPKSIKDFLIKSFNEKPWDSADMFFNFVFQNSPHKVAIVKERVAAQASGVSLIDNVFKPHQSFDPMLNSLMDLYNNLETSPKTVSQPLTSQVTPQTVISPAVNYHFVNGPAMNIVGGLSNADYELLFIDQDTDKILDQVKGREYQSKIEYFVNWKLQAKMDGKVFFEHLYNAGNQVVYIHIDSTTLGDTITWFPYVEEFRKKWNAKVTVSTHWNQLFENQYPELKFVLPGSTVFCYAMYKLGAWSEIGQKIPSDWRLGPLPSVAARILGILPYKEVKARINIPKNYAFDWDKLKRGRTKKYVCLCDRTTMEPRKSYAYWQTIVDYLVDRGYTVAALDKQGTSLRRVIKVSPGPMDKMISLLSKSELVLGISNGLTWLGWALNKPTIMVSSATAPDAEFKGTENAKKFINTEKCNSCFNDISYPVNADWRNGGVCFKNRGFECNTSVDPQEVISWMNKFLRLE